MDLAVPDSYGEFECRWNSRRRLTETGRGISAEELESELEGDLDLNGFLGLDPGAPKGYTNIRMKFKVKTDAENLKLLRRLSEFSPVYNTLSHGVNVDVEIEPK